MNRIINRPLVATIVGHVDHGKTTLIDSIRRTNVAAKEVGGITQSLGIYAFSHANLKLLLIDTPGHQTFSHSRNYGISISDLVILVIGLDDGITPECKSIVDSIVRANKPTLVCLNKIDQYGSNFGATKSSLINLASVKKGTSCLRRFIGTSGLTGEGVSTVLSYLHNAFSKSLLALVNVPAHGIIIDSHIDGRMGVGTKVIVQSGTLRPGDIVLTSNSYGKVKSIIRFDGATLKEVGPYVPITLLGLPTVSKCGIRFISVLSEQRAKEIVELNCKKLTTINQSELGRKVYSAGVDDKRARFVIKAISSNLLDATVRALQELKKKKDLCFNIISKGVGAVCKSDINMAASTGAMLLTLGIKHNAHTIRIVSKLKLQLMSYQLIYELLKDLERMAQKTIEQKKEPSILGEAQVKRLFTSSTGETILGCFVLKGIVKRLGEVGVYRNNRVYHLSKIKSLKHFKNAVDEVKQGEECGMSLYQTGSMTPCVGDLLKVYAHDNQ